MGHRPSLSHSIEPSPAVGRVFFIAALAMGVFSHVLLTARPLVTGRGTIILALAILLTWPLFRSPGLAADFCVVMVMVDWLLGGRGGGGAHFLYLPVITAVFVTTAQQTRSRWGPLLAALASAAWWLAGHPPPPATYGPKQWLLLGSALTMLTIFALMSFQAPRRRLGSIDLVLCSWSGNTAHFADRFRAGAEEAGSRVHLHRFHHFRDFRADLSAEALVIAFPVIGCKPPWPFLNYLLFHLPRGRGKSAAILYSCIGGAENAGLLCWVILTLKGYRVIGRNMSISPLNVPTFRLGPRRWWEWLDRRLPLRSEAAEQEKFGRRFADGFPDGIPFVVALTPATLVGILVDNRWLDRLLYRNYVFRRRCTGCGLCVRYCPAGRLRLVNGRPRPSGTCALCLGCVNLCPTGAMQLRFWTEYGTPYRPRWRQWVVMSPPNSRPPGSPPAIHPAGDRPSRD